MQQNRVRGGATQHLMTISQDARQGGLLPNKGGAGAYLYPDGGTSTTPTNNANQPQGYFWSLAFRQLILQKNSMSSI